MGDCYVRLTVKLDEFSPDELGPLAAEAQQRLQSLRRLLPEALDYEFHLNKPRPQDPVELVLLARYRGETARVKFVLGQEVACFDSWLHKLPDPSTEGIAKEIREWFQSNMAGRVEMASEDLAIFA